MLDVKNTNFHQDLQKLMDEFVNKVYDCTVTFPKEEVFGLTSQLRRASLPVVLNYIEGYARRRDKVFKNFLDISYGSLSLKESKYLIYFSHKRKYINDKQYDELIHLSDRIGKMLWGIIIKLK